MRGEDGFGNFESKEDIMGWTLRDEIARKVRKKTMSASGRELPEDTPQKRVSDYLEANAAKLINGFDYKPMPHACKIAAAEIVALLGTQK